MPHHLTEAGSRRRRLLQGGLAAAAAWPALSLAATTWPDRPVKLVVGYPPGTSPDFLARLVAEPLATSLGQPVVVENKPGAGGTIGVAAVAGASDGLTIGLTGNGPLTTARLFNPQLGYDVRRNLRPISLVASSPFVLVGSGSLPADPAAMLAAARAQGNRLIYASIGMGSGSHLAMELLKKLTSIQPVHVPFPGFPQVVTAMVGGQIDLAFMVPSVAVPHVKSGRVHIYGVSTASRYPAMPELVPVAQALAQPSFDVVSWNGIFGPAAMPEANAMRLSAAITAIVKREDVRQRLFEQGWQSLGTSPEGMARKIQDDTVLWGNVVRLTGAKAE